MQCGICTADKRHLTCTSCSQERAWELRYETLLRITERDALAERVHDYLESSRGSVDALQVQNTEARERIRKIREETRRLKELNAADTTKLQALRASTSARHDTLTAARTALFRLPQASAALTRDTKRLSTKHKTLHTRTSEARTFLCREAAALYNLRQKRKKTPPAITYHIGGVPIPNLLTDLNMHAPAQITTALTHLSHLLVLAAHYLGLRLPHEVLLPTRDNPTTSIRGVLNNRHLATRPLHLSVPLASLARENNAGYTKFIEGLGMLAVDVAWLCYAQGLEEVNSIEEACAPGAAMWRLLVCKDIVPGFGRCSHATAAGNLATAAGAQEMKGFRVGLAAVVERVRFTVMGEAIGAEWDLVDEIEDRVLGDSGEVVVVPEKKEEEAGPVSSSGGGGGFSGWSQLQAASAGISGWTRIRSKAEKEAK